MIPYGRQSITSDDIDAVVAVLQSDWLTQGPSIPNFESALCQLTGAEHAVAVNSATSALHIACLALGLGPGGRLWTSPNSFVASANCGLYCGAEVDFVDIDPQTYNLDPIALAEKLVIAEKNGTLPDIVIPVHFAGQSSDMREIHRLSKQYGFSIIEDASHAIGARHHGNRIGSTQYSDIAIFSFHPVKIVTTGEGGAALTNKPALAQAMSQLRSHGITRDSQQMEGESDGNWYYQQIALGLNYRMTDLQAALGISQLQRVDEFIRLRHQKRAIYEGLLDQEKITLPKQTTQDESALHLFPIKVASSKRKDIFDQLRSSGIGVNVHYIPIHLQPFYRKKGFTDGMFPIAEAYYSQAISLPIYPDLTQDDQQYICKTLNNLITAI